MQGSRQVVEAFATLPEHQKEPVKRCAHEMIAGMRVMTGAPSGEGVKFVSSTLGDLEQYCHYVAGTVGQMLTRLFGSHVGGWFASDERVEQGRRFGLGLQMTNILKDFVDDRRAGISFLPKRWLREKGDETEIHPRHKRELVERTLGHLDIAHRYTLALPREEEGIRLFCVWALWMAVTTLREICVTSGETPKIDRSEVEEIITYSRQVIGDDQALDRRYKEYRRQAAIAAAGLAP
jgi:farnesyl-diphosphate farnesyltransferase